MHTDRSVAVAHRVIVPGRLKGLHFRRMLARTPTPSATSSKRRRRPSTIEEEATEADSDDCTIHHETRAERILNSILSDDDDSDEMLPMSSEFSKTTTTGGAPVGRSTFGVVPDSSLRSCLDLLSSSDLDQNRVGLQRLMLLSKGRALSGMHRSEELASHVLVYGGQLGSFEDRLRYVFATMICAAPHDDTGMLDRGAFLGSQDDDDDDDDGDDDSTNPHIDDLDLDEFDSEFDADRIGGLERPVVANADPSERDGESMTRDDHEEKEDYKGVVETREGRDYDDSSDEDDSGEEQGKAWGALHNHALRVLANALTQVVNSSGDQIVPIPLHDTIWRNLIRAVVTNIENHTNADTTGYSLKILRMIHSIHPEMAQPLLRQTLFPHLVYLSDYGERHRFPMIYTEASYLLKRATSP
jgi:hypothetical protein